MHITNIFAKNKNINILYKVQFSKFGIDKYKIISMWKIKNKNKKTLIISRHLMMNKKLLYQNLGSKIRI